MPLVTFIIPVRHPQNAPDWAVLCARLEQTLASVANQSLPDWACIVVANEGVTLPSLPKGVTVAWVDFPPNELYDLTQYPREMVYDAVRLDKGRRVLAGMMAALQSNFFMVVDDDDLLSNAIVAHVARNPEVHGWFIEQGYLWDDGGHWLLRIEQFDRLCGTSLIVRSDLYGLPPSAGAAEVDWIKTMLGSHILIKPILAARGTPLEPLPFPGAVYRVGSSSSHSQSPGLWRKGFFNRSVCRRPHRVIGNLTRLRWIGSALRREFFGPF